MFEIVCLCLFACLVAVGVHSVTRPDKLLWFLGARVHAYDTANFLAENMYSQLDAILQTYDDKLVEIHNGNLIPVEKDEAIDKAKDEYNAALSEIKNKYEIEIDWHKKRGAIVEKRWYMKIILPIAPALTECLTCMASVWGGVMFVFYSCGLFLCPIVVFPFTLLAIAGLNTIAGRLIH